MFLDNKGAAMECTVASTHNLLPVAHHGALSSMLSLPISALAMAFPAGILALVQPSWHSPTAWACGGAASRQTAQHCCTTPEAARWCASHGAGLMLLQQLEQQLSRAQPVAAAQRLTEFPCTCASAKGCVAAVYPPAARHSTCSHCASSD